MSLDRSRLQRGALGQRSWIVLIALFLSGAVAGYAHRSRAYGASMTEATDRLPMTRWTTPTPVIFGTPRADKHCVRDAEHALRELESWLPLGMLAEHEIWLSTNLEVDRYQGRVTNYDHPALGERTADDEVWIALATFDMGVLASSDTFMVPSGEGITGALYSLDSRGGDMIATSFHGPNGPDPERKLPAALPDQRPACANLPYPTPTAIVGLVQTSDG